MTTTRNIQQQLEQVRREMDRQDERLADATRALARNKDVVSVPRSELAAIAAACLVHVSATTPAIRG